MTKLTDQEKSFCGKGYRGIIHQLIRRYQVKRANKSFRKVLEEKW